MSMDHQPNDIKTLLYKIDTIIWTLLLQVTKTVLVLQHGMCILYKLYVYAIHGHPSHSKPLQALHRFQAIQVTQLHGKSSRRIHAVPIQDNSPD